MKIVWNILDLLLAIRYDPRFKQGVDSMLDPLEEIFADEKKVIKACNKIRKTLDVPDDDLDII